MWNAGLDKSQAAIKTARRNINNLRYAYTSPMAESEKELKNLLMRVKKDMKQLTWNSTLKQVNYGIQSYHFMANRRKKVKAMIDFILFQNQCGWWLQPWNLKILAFWEENYKPRGHIKKQKHPFANKGPCSQAMVFPVTMYRYESWTIRKAECQRIDGFKLQCWKRLLRVPWTARYSNEIKVVNPKGTQSWVFNGRMMLKF